MGEESTGSHFVSLVGFQILAVVNPLLALQKAGRGPRTVTLWPTAKTLGVAEEIRKRLAGPGCEVIIDDVADGLTPGQAHRLTVGEGARRLAGGTDPILFNLAGGMNFHLAAAVQALPLDRTTFLYPEEEHVLQFRFLADGSRERVTLPLPDPVDVLAWQGVPFRQIRMRGPVPKILPPGVQVGIEIDGMVFDLVRNEGNTLSFLRILDSSFEGPAAMESKALRETCRGLLAWGKDRRRFGHLYHRHVTVLCSRSLIRNRLASESAGKIRVSPFDRKSLDSWMSKARQHQPGSFSSSGSVPSPWQRSGGQAGRVTGPILVVILGPDPLPTLVAIWSHQPRKVFLLYDSHHPTIRSLAETWQNLAQVFPVAELIGVPVDFEPLSVLDIEVKTAPEHPVEVNVTPGTKLQGAILCLLARMRGATVWTLDNQTGCSRTFADGGMSRPMVGPSPQTLLLLRGENLAPESAGKDQLGRKDRLYRTVLRWYERAAMQKGAPEPLLPGKRISLPGAVFDGGRFLFDGEKASDRLLLVLNIWFEEFVAWRFLRAGAEDAQVRLRTLPPGVVGIERDANGIPIFKSDFDVVLRRGHVYWVVSCKSGRVPGVIRHSVEAEALASCFGRFAVPLVIHLPRRGPANEINGVWWGGLDVLVDDHALAGLLDIALASRRTTRPAE